MVFRKDLIPRGLCDAWMQGCDSEGVVGGSRRDASIRMGWGFTENDNSKGTRCQGVFTLQ